MSYYVIPYFQQPPSNTRNTSTQHGRMTVEGSGKITISPDTAILQIGVVTEAKEVEATQTQNAILSNNVLSALNKINLSLDDIQTIIYTIQPIYEFTEGASVLTGYRAQHILELTVRDLKNLGTVYETATTAGANITENIRFDVSNREILYLEALQSAMKNATEKAIKLGKQIGVTINSIPLKVTESSIIPTPHQLVYSLSADTVSHSTPPIQRNKIEIVANLIAVFQY